MRSGTLSRELRIVHDLAQVVAAGPYEVDEIVDRICAATRTAFGLERALFVRIDIVARTIFAPVQQGIEWPGDQWLLLDKFPFLVQALESRRAVFVEDARRDAALPAAIAERFDVHSLVAVPLLVEGDCVGFIVGDRRGGGGRFELNQDELAFLTTLGVVAGVFIAKAEQYETLRRALEEVERLDTARNDFISIASHELRTPIAAVHGIAATLYRRGDEVSDSQRSDLRRGLFTTTTRLVALVEQLLDLSRIDSGVLSLSETSFSARDSLQAIVEDAAPSHRDGIQLQVPQSLELTCDPHAFERVMSNVVANACRYGEPPVIVRAEQGDTTRIVVQDHGRGVDPAFAPRLFDRFARSNDSRLGEKEGAGLGLSIARSFARALGGDLTYEAAEPTGARFTLELPASAGNST